MRDRHLALLLLLLTAAAGRDDGEEDESEHSAGLVSRFAARATGAVVNVVEPDALLDRIDVNALLDRVDPDALLDRVDPNALLDRVDVNALMDRVDIDALLARVDVEELVERAGIADIVRESTGALAGSALDVFRRQIVALDSIVGRSVYRVTRRDPSDRPRAPHGLEAATGVDETGRRQITGHFAGPVSRLLGFAADAAIIWAGFLMLAFGGAWLVGAFTNIDTTHASFPIIGLLVLSSWTFTYFWVAYSIAGKTFGMAIFGLRVLNREGENLTGRQAAVRTFVQPFSIGFFGLGCLGILFSPERRSLHDAAAGSVVVYDWGDRPAEMPAPITKWVEGREIEE